MHAATQLTSVSDETRRIIALVAERVWVDTAAADTVSARRRGWLGRLANQVGVERPALKLAIADIGDREFDALVAGNPAGDAPVVTLSDGAMASTHGSCLHGTGTCGSCLHQTGTCGTCAACYSSDGSLMN